jgi:hypothetical protein
VSFALDIARGFQLAAHMDVLHGLDNAGRALAKGEVFCMLFICEFAQLANATQKFSYHPHAMVLNRLMVSKEGKWGIEVKSPREAGGGRHRKDSGGRFPENARLFRDVVWIFSLIFLGTVYCPAAFPLVAAVCSRTSN